MKADGSVIIEAKMDISRADKDLGKLKKKIESTESEINELDKEREKTANEGVFKAAELDAEKRKLAEMKRELQEMRAVSKDKTYSEGVRAETKAAIPGMQEDVADQRTRVQMLQTEYNKLENAVTRYDKKLEDAQSKLESQTEEAGELAKKINAALEEAEKVTFAEKKMAEAQEAAAKSAAKFGTRLKKAVATTLGFTVILQTLQALRNYAGKLVVANNDAAAAVARLKGALLTMVQPILNVVIPAFVTLVNVLTAIIGRVSQLLSALFGTTTEQAAEAAKAINTQVEALEATGQAAKKADKSLAAFDKLNKLSAPDSQSGQTGTGGATSIGEIKPDFAWADELDGKFKQIADDVLLIGATLALWKISDHIPGLLDDMKSKLGSLAVACGGLILMLEGASDAWENGIDWVNAAEMIGGATAAVLGLYKAFGKTGGAIGLLLAGITLMVTGFKDIMDNGLNLQNTLITLAGIIAAGLSISVLTGSIIPMLIAALLGLGILFVELTGNGEQMIANLKQIFTGFTNFIDGRINGDIDKMIEGLKDMVKGSVNLILTLVGSLVNAIIKGLNWLIDMINSITFSVPEWVPGVGGKSLSPNIAPVGEWPIPQLAKGAVIPPNREFMAVLGDQTNGRNLEAPEGLIRQIVREESVGMNTELLQAILQAIREGKVLVVDGVQFGKLVYSVNKAESRRVGVSLSDG